jgi:hypothetical protein
MKKEIMLPKDVTFSLCTMLCEINFVKYAARNILREISSLRLRNILREIRYAK